MKTSQFHLGIQRDCHRCGEGNYQITIATWAGRDWLGWPTVLATMAEHKIEDEQPYVYMELISGSQFHTGMSQCNNCAWPEPPKDYFPID